MNKPLIFLKWGLVLTILFYVSTLHAQVDLSIINANIINNSIPAGKLESISCQVQNSGSSVPASAVSVDYYLSRDMVLDTSDINLDYRTVSVSANSATNVSSYITIPLSTDTGSYYILLIADASIPTATTASNYHLISSADDQDDLREVAESDETNNIAVIPVVVTASSPDLSIPSFSASPSTLGAGMTTTVYYNVNNTGIATGAGAHFTGYYLSSDAIFDASDTYLGGGYIDTVPANGTTRDTALVLIPPTTPVGSYYLIFYADYQGQQTEQDETNNTRARAITVSSSNSSSNSYADLVVQSPAVGNTTVAASATTTVSCTVRNIGSGNCFSYARVGYYLSTTPYYNSAMIELWSSSVGSLNSNTSINVGTNVMIPPGTPAGNYYILFFVDDYRLEPESNENNNIASIFITVTGSTNTQTDLIVDNPSVSAATTIVGLPAIPAGNTLNLTSTIKNLGNSASASFVGYYLSTDQTYSTSDVYLGNEAVGSLPANGSSLETSTITIPLTTSTGSYYILFRADDQGQITERVETNNVAAVPFKVIAPKPDLVPQNALLSPNVLAAGHWVGVSCRIANIGAGAARATNIGYYWSTVPSYTSAAIFLGAAYIPNLAANTSVQKNFALPVPVTTLSGTYYLLLYADYQGLEPESNETNNIAVQAITILGNPLYQPDVIVEYPNILTNNLVAGGTTTVDCSIRSQGGVAANSAITGYYLSIDTLLDNTDALVGSSLMAPTNPNDTLFQTATITIPYYTPAGNYYLLYVADRLNALIESNESNNIAYLPLSITASQTDLVVKQATAAPTTIFSGDVVTVNSWVHNQGSMAIANTELGYYLSTDTLHDNGDVYLNVSPIDTLQAGDSSAQQLALTIPMATNTGNYYLLYYADHQVTRAEGDKTNNIAHVLLSVTASRPDLRIQQATLATDTIVVGASVNLTAFLNNIGTVTSGSSKVGYYLSTDSTYSANDVLLTNENNSGLGVGNSVALNSNITLPNTTAVGNYYILFYADYQNSVAENNEANNVEAVAVTVIFPLPDLLLGSAVVSAPSTIYPGDVINVSCIINNNSVQGVGSHRLGCYFNTTILLGNALITGVAGNGSVSQSMNLTIPLGTAAGYYYIAFHIDDQLAIAESNETNNRVYRQIYVTAPNLPDATVLTATINPSSTIAGETIALSSSIRNIGNTAFSNGTLSYYLSPTPTYNSNTAVFLDNTNAAYSLSYNRTVTDNVSIPTNTVAGNYYILFYADAPNLIVESDESNNILAVAITIREVFSDLTVLPSSAVFRNGNIEASTMLSNNGTVSSGATTLGYFLSTNSLYDNGDVLLGTDAVGVLLPSSNSSQNGVFPIATNTANGQYYVLFVVDYLNAVVEEDETNNTLAVPVIVTIDINKLPTAELLIYPNPTLQSVAVELGRTYQEVQVQVYNPLGQLIQTTKPQTTANLSLDLEGPTGVYLLQITTKEGSFGGIPIVKE